jgi:hypothetical protein
MIPANLRYTLMFRWSVASTAAIALFWTGWYFINGPVPVVSEFQMSQKWVISFPFALSRWWDVLLGPISAVTVVSFFSSKYYCDYKENLDTGLGVGLGAGLGVGLAGGLVFGLTFGLAFGLAFGLKHLFKMAVASRTQGGVSRHD